VVTFNNHGVEQEIPLVKAPPINTPTPVVMNTMNTSFTPSPAPYYGYKSGKNFDSAGNGQAQQRLSPEEQMIMMAAQHAEAQQRGDPMAAIFPPTPLDDAAGVTPNNGSSSAPPAP